MGCRVGEFRYVEPPDDPGYGFATHRFLGGSSPEVQLEKSHRSLGARFGSISLVHCLVQPQLSALVVHLSFASHHGDVSVLDADGTVRLFKKQNNFLVF